MITMVRRFIAALAASAVLLPNAAFAIATPAELMEAIGRGGEARDIKMELHGNDGSTYFSVWMRGTSEGQSIASAKANVNATVDVFENGSTLRSRLEIVVADQTAYVRLTEVFNNPPKIPVPPTIAGLKGQWAKLPLNAAEVAQLGGTDLEIPTEAEAMGQEMLNQLFTFERQGFSGGHVYYLSLQPDFLSRLAQFITGTGLVPAEISSEFLSGLPEIGQAIVVDVKVDTDKEGAFLFGRLRVAADLDGFSFKLLSESTARAPKDKVDVTVPTAAILLEDLMWGMDSSGIAPVISITAPTPDASPFALPWDTANQAVNRRAISNEMECDAELGTLRYQQLARKGICPLPPESRPRRGTQRR